MTLHVADRSNRYIFVGIYSQNNKKKYNINTENSHTCTVQLSLKVVLFQNTLKATFNLYTISNNNIKYIHITFLL